MPKLANRIFKDYEYWRGANFDPVKRIGAIIRLFAPSADTQPASAATPNCQQCGEPSHAPQHFGHMSVGYPQHDFVAALPSVSPAQCPTCGSDDPAKRTGHFKYRPCDDPFHTSASVAPAKEKKVDG